MTANNSFPTPAQVDILNERSIILHIRALLDFHDLLLNGYETEFLNFTKKLHDVGWGENRINEFVQAASAGSRYNYLVSLSSWEHVRTVQKRRGY